MSAMDKSCEKGCYPYCEHRTDGLCYWGSVAAAASALCDAVERYVCPKRGDKSCLRSELLNTKDRLREALKR